MSVLATVVLKNKPGSPYSQSRAYEVPKLDKELARDYEERTWRERMHVDDNGGVVMPCMGFKNCICDSAKLCGIQIPGKGKERYTKHFERGIMVMGNPPIGVHRDDVQGEWLFVPSNGVSGHGQRVHKCFPRIPEWQVTVEFLVISDGIPKDVFVKVLSEAGLYTGVGRFRPERSGYYGRFDVVNVDWKKQ